VTGLEDCDVVIHAGDVGGPEILDALPAPIIAAVYGNNDTQQRWGGTDVALPECVCIDVSDGTIVVIHGHQFREAKRRHARLRARFPDARVIVYGHSHRRCIDDDDIPWVINPGACGRARTFGGPSAVLLDWRRQRWCARELTVT
jgi:putative phosphoesterase